MVTWFLVLVLGLFMTVLCALLTAVRNIDVATVRDTREWRSRSTRGGVRPAKGRIQRDN